MKYRVSGPDFAQVHAIALQVAEQLGAITGMRHINFDWSEPARVMRVHIDQDQARQLGVSSEDVALALNNVVSGSTITQVRNSIYLIDVVMRAEQTQRTSLETIRWLQIPLHNGQVVALAQIATFEYTQEYPIIWRRNWVPTLNSAGRCDAGPAAGDGGGRVQPSIDRLAATLPNGYRIVPGGSVEESGKAKASVEAVLPVMLVLVLTILMFQLQSLQRVILVFERGAARSYRGGRSLAACASAARLRCDARGAGPRRHDRAQFGDPHRSGRDGGSAGHHPWDAW